MQPSDNSKCATRPPSSRGLFGSFLSHASHFIQYFITSLRTGNTSRALCRRTAAFLLGLASVLPAARADDIELYINQTPDPTRPPLTVLALDLNLDPTAIVCNNIFLGTTPDCATLQSSLTLNSALSLIGVNAATVRSLVLTLSLGVVDINSLLGTALNLISLSTRTLLSTAVGPVVSQVTGLTIYKGFLQNLLSSLVNFRLAVFVSHNNKGTPTSSSGVSYACNFADLGSVPGPRASTTACSNGAYVFLGFVDLLNDPLKTNYNIALNKLTNLAAKIGVSVHPYQGKELYNELHHYLTGGLIYNGHLGNFDFGNADSSKNLPTTNSLLSWDTSVESGSRYKSALDQFGSCDSVNVLNVMFTNSAGDGDSDTDLAANFPGADRNGDGSISFAELVTQAASSGFTYKNNVEKLNSYFMINGAGADATLLSNLGNTVVAVPSLVNLLGLGNSAAQYLQPVLVTNASLLTPSLAVDLTAPNKTLNSAFFASFKPEDKQKPRWSGNLKKLNLSNGLYVDANNRSAISADGRIDPAALTFWTSSASLGGLNGDGRESTLGGAGSRIPGFGDTPLKNPGRVNTDNKRKLYYDKYLLGVPAARALDADDAAVQSDLQSDLGAASLSEAKTLMLYARGYEVGKSSDSPQPNLATVSGRSWMHGAVLHSHPVAINYGARSGYSASNPDVRVIYGSTDGWLRMLRNTASGGTQSGAEDWAFMPRVLMKQQKILRDDVSSSVFPYGVDGSPVAVVMDRDSNGGPGDGKIDSSNPNDKAYLYFGLRRGGSYYYGLDVTNPDAAPNILWRIGADGLYNASGLVSGSTSWFNELALGFSNPVPARMKITQGSTTAAATVLVFGGGYNGGRDVSNTRIGKDLNRGTSNQVGLDDNKGNALYIVDAVTGALLWKAKAGSFNSTTPYTSASLTYQHPLLADGIASDVSLIDTDGDGYADRLYVADTGGRLWRGDFPGTDRSKWTLTPVASVGRHASGASTVQNDRRFFHAPDYVPVRSGGRKYDAVVFASGDREDPLNVGTENWLYTFRDAGTVTGKTAAQILLNDSDLKHQADFTDLTSTCGNGSTSACSAASDLSTGWRVKLSDAGEKDVSQPLTLGGTVFLSTFVPPASSVSQCVPSEGSGKLYAVSLENGRGTYQPFKIDSDGDNRTRRTAADGLAGEFTTATINRTLVSDEALDVSVPKFYPIYWRERRGDDEKPVQQP